MAKKSAGGRLTRDEADRRVERLLQIALEEFSTRGFGATSLDRLVFLSGVSKTTMIRRFGNKEGLFLTLVEKNVAVVQQEVWSVTMDVNDPQATMERLIEAFVRSAVQSPMGSALLRLAVMEKFNFPTLGETLLEMAEKSFRNLADYLSALMQAGVIGQTDPMEAVFDLQGLATQGFRSLLKDPEYLSRPGRSAEIAAKFLKGWS